MRNNVAFDFHNARRRSASTSMSIEHVWRRVEHNKYLFAENEFRTEIICCIPVRRSIWKDCLSSSFAISPGEKMWINKLQLKHGTTTTTTPVNRRENWRNVGKANIDSSNTNANWISHIFEAERNARHEIAIEPFNRAQEMCLECGPIAHNIVPKTDLSLREWWLLFFNVFRMENV